jgi:hypothetical protein
LSFTQSYDAVKFIGVVTVGLSEDVAARSCTTFSTLVVSLELSVGVTRHAEILETEGLSTEESQPGRTFGERSGGFSKWRVMIGRAGFVTISSIPDPTLSFNAMT